MKCMSHQLIAILPPRLRSFIQPEQICTCRNIRFRIDMPVQMQTSSGLRALDTICTAEDMSWIINAASKYSPWSASTAASGYLAAPGGHRIGICGDVIQEQGTVKGIRSPTSICIRVAKEIPGISNRVELQNSLLIIGPPGSGKTTLLRDIIRRIGAENRGAVSVVDERGELFPSVCGKSCFDHGGNADIITGCSKEVGIETVLRSMSPDWIAVDEITAAKDCRALLQAGWCAVKLMATAHAANMNDLQQRPLYRPLVETGLFPAVIVMDAGNSWHMERVGP